MDLYFDFDLLTQQSADLRQPVREISHLEGQTESDSPQELPQDAAFSPFVLQIPEIMPQGIYEDSDVHEDFLADDIHQFGSPLPLAGVSQPQSQRFSLQKIIQKRVFKVKAKARTPRALKISRHGTSYSSLPAAMVQNISTTFARSISKKRVCLSKDSMAAILDASDRFFEQLGDDLAAASSHAGRKTIDECDVLAVMRRCEPSLSFPARFSDVADSKQATANIGASLSILGRREISAIGDNR